MSLVLRDRLNSKLACPAATALVRRFILSDEDIKKDPLKFVEGWGWDHTKWAKQEFPTAVGQFSVFGGYITHLRGGFH